MEDGAEVGLLSMRSRLGIFTGDDDRLILFGLMLSGSSPSPNGVPHSSDNASNPSYDSSDHPVP